LYPTTDASLQLKKKERERNIKKRSDEWKQQQRQSTRLLSSKSKLVDAIERERERRGDVIVYFFC
jgi:hypothetical protein